MLTKSHAARLLIVVYSADDKFSGAYLESHQVDDKGRILEGKPLKQETIQGLVDVFFDEHRNAVKVGGMLPTGLLQFDRLPGGRYKMVWFRPAERRYLYFAPDLKIKSGEAWVPPMVYAADGRSLDVFALAKDSRPTETTALCRAPFHNVSKEGDVCLGSAKVKKPADNTYTSLMKYWEDMFWLSEFTHLTGDENPTKTNINLLWPQLIKDKTLTWADLKELQVMKNVTLKKLL